MQCLVCGEKASERARFCAACGSPLPVQCPACSEIMSPGARFCTRCGTRLPEPLAPSAKSARGAERRQLSVMLCDLVDSTPLSGRLDPEDLAEVIHIYQSRVATAIAQFGGYIARYIGDGVLSYFGWPEGNEADAECAIHAALAVVATVGKTPIRGETLQVRVGI